ncbi:hypothetical protein, partial [Dactylosporangium sp. NPDC006015]|uniref:hypothetical protein n=1 Tax=Dactylosporangium sp. NPDC006015 TaxID=3154576 RepID=UPI0033BBA09F
ASPGPSRLPRRRCRSPRTRWSPRASASSSSAIDALAARLLDPLLRSITARQRAERDRRDGHGRR